MTVVRRALVSVLVAVALGLVVGAVTAWHDGYRVYAVRTGSMTPTYPTGALVIDAPASHGTPSVGDVITFRVSTGLVTHRVYSISASGYATKGDANPTPDAWTIPRGDVVGHVVAGVAGAGYVLVFFQQPTGAATVVTALLALSLLWGLFFPADAGANAHEATHPARPHRRPAPRHHVAAAASIAREPASIGVPRRAVVPSSDGAPPADIETSGARRSVVPSRRRHEVAAG